MPKLTAAIQKQTAPKSAMRRIIFTISVGICEEAFVKATVSGFESHQRIIRGGLTTVNLFYLEAPKRRNPMFVRTQEYDIFGGSFHISVFQETAMGCMDELKGKWAFTKLPDNLKQESIEISSNRSGDVTGAAIILVDGARNQFRVSGMYDKTTKVMMIGFDGSEIPLTFSFSGGCYDNNVFVGRLAGDFDSAAELKYLG